MTTDGRPTTLAFERMDHVQVNVIDLAAAKRFYSDVLGLTEVPRPDSFDFAGCWYRIGEMDLHLVVRAPEPASDRHICLWTSDIQGAAHLLEGRGVAVAWMRHLKIEGVDRFFIRDPEGHRIEVQGPDGTGHSRWERPGAYAA